MSRKLQFDQTKYSFNISKRSLYQLKVEAAKYGITAGNLLRWLIETYLKVK